MTDARPLKRALRAYERLDRHFSECASCSGEDEAGACDAAFDLWDMARLQRQAALAERSWRMYELSLSSDGRPVTR